MQIRWMLIVTIVCTVVLAAGYSLTQVEPEVVSAAAPVVDKVIGAQATSIEEVQARSIQPLSNQKAVFVDESFGYHISYPTTWLKTELSSNVVVFQSNDGATRVKVEVASALPADGLAGFVDRSLGKNVLLTRQSLTVHGLSAERVLLYSHEAHAQVTNFYVTADNMVYIISGVGRQKLIESVARSFNAPQLVAQQ